MGILFTRRPFVVGISCSFQNLRWGLKNELLLFLFQQAKDLLEPILHLFFGTGRIPAFSEEEIEHFC